MQNIFNRADADKTGAVSRAHIRKAIENDKVLEQVKAIQSDLTSLEDPIVAQVMKSLENVNGALIS